MSAKWLVKKLVSIVAGNNMPVASFDKRSDAIDYIDKHPNQSLYMELVFS